MGRRGGKGGWWTATWESHGWAGKDWYEDSWHAGASCASGQCFGNESHSSAHIHWESNWPGNVAENYNKVAREFSARRDAALPRDAFRDVNNRVTRRVVDAALTSLGSPVNFLIDAACGKGGGLSKYAPFLRRGGHCVLVDISSESVSEAQQRTKQSRSIANRGLNWTFHVEDCFVPEYWQRFGSRSVDAISCQFALHYAFENLPRAQRLFQEIARSLRPGAVFFGVIADAKAVIREFELEATGEEAPQLFRISEFQGPAHLGGRYTFELNGHVLPTEEFLVPLSDLRHLGQSCGLEPISDVSPFWQNFSELAELRGVDSETFRLCRLYCTFAFRRRCTEEEQSAFPAIAAGCCTGASLHRTDKLAGPVAVYTGSFDPMHRNHVRLCQHVLSKRGFSHIYIYPNGDSPYKPDAIPVAHRIEMARFALHEAGVADRCTVSLAEAGDWKGRVAICNRLSDAHDGADVYLMLGQDSYETSVERASERMLQDKAQDKGSHRGGKGRKGSKGKAARGKGIFSMPTSGHKILVFPRLGSHAAVEMPSELKGAVAVLDDYTDPLQISSTIVREALLDGSSLTDFIHTSVEAYIHKHDLYR